LQRGRLVSVNDEGLECLRRAPQLRRLVLRGLDGSGGSGGLGPSLREGRPEITDAGLVYIESLPNLEFLDLSGTKVTPAGLLRLRGMAKLRELVILGIPIGAEQEKSLRRALAHTTIRTGPLDATDLGREPFLGYKPMAELLREPDPDR
jgi:hypothetical protein